MATGLLVGAIAIAVVSGLIAALDGVVDPPALGGLYVFAILVVAMVRGFWLTAAVAVASYLTFDFLFIPPSGTLRVSDGDVVATVAISLATAFVVIALARRERQRVREARLRAQDAEHAHSDLSRLADEQAALGRIATLIAREASQARVFTAIAEEIGKLLGTEEIRMLRYEDDWAVVVGSAGEHDELFPVESRVPLGGDNVASRLFATRQPARMDDYANATGEIAGHVRSIGIRSAVGTPIWVEGRLWGAMVTATTRAESLPPDTESRLSQFTDLMATAIANTESHAGAARLADEQASLRRVALLIATEASLEEVFGKVAEEVGQVLGDVDFALVRDDGGGSATTVAVSGGSVSAVFRPGVRMALDQRGVVGRVISEGRSCRIDDYAAATENVAEAARERGVGAAVGCPIEVGGRTWGAMVVARREREPFPPETETRIAQFSEVVATGIANSESREALRQLADEQAALRRVATLVAEGAAPDAVFDAVAEEMKRLLDADRLNLCRYEREGEMTVMAHRGTNAWRLPPGTRMSYDGESVTAMVRSTGTPARMDTYEGAPGALAEVVRLMGTRSAIGAPVVVAGRVWGVMAASWNGDLSPPAGTEQRMAQFAALLDTAIANADSRALLEASRVRLLTASDDARRRVVRDLHDGAQQRLMHTIVTLKLAQRALEQQDGSAPALVDEALENAQLGTEEIRELARGILPTALTRGGLQPAIDSVVERLDLPVEADVPAKRFPAEIEASAYFIVAEALTNVVKHARARRAAIKASVQQGLLQIEVRDDGIGGADPDGHGVVGISDRAAALGGRLTIESPADGGTVVTATLPLSVGESAPHFRLAQDQEWRTG